MYMGPIHLEDYLEYLYVTGQLEKQIVSEKEEESTQEEDEFVYVKKDARHENC